MKQRLATWVTRHYLDSIVALDFPEQAPAHAFAKWYDAFWMLIPLFGSHEMCRRIEERYERAKWWAAYCPKCQWSGLSRDCEGGHPIADTGDYDEVLCPKCLHPVE